MNPSVPRLSLCAAKHSLLSFSHPHALCPSYFSLILTPSALLSHSLILTPSVLLTSLFFLILSSSRPLPFFLLSSLEPVEGGWPPTYDENFANQQAGSDAALKSLESEPYINHMLQFMVAEGNYPMASV